MRTIKTDQLTLTRRHFFEKCGVGLGKIALSSLLAESVNKSFAFAGPAAGLDQTMPKPHFAPKAKSVIHLFMSGGPSQLDLFDYKPALAKWEGKPIPPEIIKGQRYAFIRPDAAALGPQFKFSKHGQCGAELSEVLPHLAKIVDDICIVKSMCTDQFNHAPAQLTFNTGFRQFGRPSMGAWAVYGLGSETKDLPAFMVMSSGEGTNAGTANWGSGFMPSTYGGVLLRSEGDAILDVANPDGIDGRVRRDTLDLIDNLNREHFNTIRDPEINARIASHEMAYRLQTSSPELSNLRNESKAVLEMYGADPDKPSFARSCLLARRMVERGVRFVNVYQHGWDAHSDVAGNSRQFCGLTDQPAAALVQDLKARGLLDETLVIWSGEFGRTPMVESNPSQGRKLGRDHHPQAFTVWIAGGGFKPGFTYGATDELGFNIVENPVHIHDLQATILHQLGLDHERLTYRYSGRDFRLTDVDGQVIKDILA